jgi:hypothetical protein
MLKFAILKRKIDRETDEEYFEVAETALHGHLEYDSEEFFNEVIPLLEKSLKKGLITRKVKFKDIRRNLLKALDDATKTLKQKTIYVK